MNCRRIKKTLKFALFATLRVMVSGADGRSRTGMESIRRILSAVRLPIPPHRHVFLLSTPQIAFGNWRDMVEGY